MNKILKTINRHNGNLCFVGRTGDSRNSIFECQRSERSLLSDESTKTITGLCHKEGSIYLVSFSDQYIGTFSSGLLNEATYNTGLSSIDCIAGRTDSIFYAINASSSNLLRFTLDPFDIDWSIEVDGLSSNSRLIIRQSDETIILHNNNDVYWIADLSTHGEIMQKQTIMDGNKTFVQKNGEFNVGDTFLRWRQKDVEALEFSSSSSSEGHSTSSSSSSGGSSTSSSSSSGDYSTSSSSSSEDYSTSSSSSPSSSSSSSSAFNIIMANGIGFIKHPTINGEFYFDGWGSPDGTYMEEPRGINDNGVRLYYSNVLGVVGWWIDNYEGSSGTGLYHGDGSTYICSYSEWMESVNPGDGALEEAGGFGSSSSSSSSS